MNRKFVITGILILYCQAVYPSLSTLPNKKSEQPKPEASQTEQPNNKPAENAQPINKSENTKTESSKKSPQPNKKSENQKVKSIVTPTPLNQDAKATAFLGSNKFYVVTAADGENSMARLVMSRAEDTTWQVSFTPMAPSSGVTINNLKDQQSPLNNIDLSLLTVGAYTNGSLYPVTGLISGADPDQKVFIYQVLDLYEGKILLKNADAKLPNTVEYELKDTAAQGAKGLHSIAATKNAPSYIFALTSDNPVLKDATLTTIGVSPIAVISPTPEKGPFLNPLDATDFSKSGVNNKSAGILDALKIGGDPAPQPNASTDMVWDDKLQTLYIAVSNIQTAGAQGDGVIALLKGKISGTKLAISKVTDETIAPDDKSRIIGYVNGTTVSQMVNLFKVRVMHTSTGKDYLIVQGQVVQDTNADNTPNTVFALPLALDGTLQELVPNTADRAKVGKDFHYLIHSNDNTALSDGKIQDIQVFGDTVYVAVAGSRGSDPTNADEAGIFTSTAIFKEDGTARAWKTWPRTMGCTDRAYNIGFDKNSGNFWYIGGPDQKTAKVTVWSFGDTSETGVHEGAPLSTALSPFFTQDQLGVVGLFNFDDETLGFKSWKPESDYPAFSMMIATGYGKIALIQTGTRDDNNIFLSLIHI